MSTFHPGTSVFRNLLLLESVANVIGGVGMLFSPSTSLSFMAKSPALETSGVALNLIQFCGGLSFALAAPLLLGYPNTATGVASRYAGYVTLGAGEVFLVGIMGWQYVSGQSGFSDNFLLGGMAVLGGVLGLRAYTIAIRPDWMGYIKEDSKSA